MKAQNEKDLSHAERNAVNWLALIIEMVEAVDDNKTDNQREEGQTAIQESILSLEIRGGWYAPGEKPEDTPEEFKILLSTGGPALRLVGTLGKYSEPESVTMEHQDWGTPWIEHRLNAAEEEKVLTFCRRFYFGG